MKISHGYDFQGHVESFDQEVEDWRERAVTLLGQLLLADEKEEVEELRAEHLTTVDERAIYAAKTVVENVYIALCAPDERRTRALLAGLRGMGASVEMEEAAGPAEESAQAPVVIHAAPPPEPSPGWKSPSPPVSPVVAATPPPHVSQPVGGIPSPAASLDETAALNSDMLGDLEEEIMPFEDDATARPLAAPGLTDDEQRSAPRRGATGYMPVMDPPPATGTPPITVESYAALVARLESDEEPASVIAAFGLETMEQADALKQTFSLAFKRDAELQATFERLLDEWRTWLEQQGA